MEKSILVKQQKHLKKDLKSICRKLEAVKKQKIWENLSKEDPLFMMLFQSMVKKILLLKQFMKFKFMKTLMNWKNST